MQLVYQTPLQLEKKMYISIWIGSGLTSRHKPQKVEEFERVVDLGPRVEYPIPEMTIIPTHKLLPVDLEDSAWA